MLSYFSEAPFWASANAGHESRFKVYDTSYNFYAHLKRLAFSGFCSLGVFFGGNFFLAFVGFGGCLAFVCEGFLFGFVCLVLVSATLFNHSEMP